MTSHWKDYELNHLLSPGKSYPVTFQDFWGQVPLAAETKRWDHGLCQGRWVHSTEKSLISKPWRRRIISIHLTACYSLKCLNHRNRYIWSSHNRPIQACCVLSKYTTLIQSLRVICLRCWNSVCVISIDNLATFHGHHTVVCAIGMTVNTGKLQTVNSPTGRRMWTCSNIMVLLPTSPATYQRLDRSPRDQWSTNPWYLSKTYQLWMIKILPPGARVNT